EQERPDADALPLPDDDRLGDARAVDPDAVDAGQVAQPQDAAGLALEQGVVARHEGVRQLDVAVGGAAEDQAVLDAADLGRGGGGRGGGGVAAAGAVRRQGGTAEGRGGFRRGFGGRDGGRVEGAAALLAELVGVGVDGAAGGTGFHGGASGAGGAGAPAGGDTT